MPFFTDNDEEALRSLVAAALVWLQKSEGTVVEVNSQGELSGNSACEHHFQQLVRGTATSP